MRLGGHSRHTRTRILVLSSSWFTSVFYALHLRATACLFVYPISYPPFLLRVCVLQINLVPVLGQEGDDFTTSALWLIYDNADNLADFHRPNLPWTFAVRGLNEK